MAFGTLDGGEHDEPLAEINMVPFIDVMLVLLIIFIVTAPLLTHSVKVDLPRASSEVDVAKPNAIEVAIDAQRRLWWNGEPIEPDALELRLAAAALEQPPPELHLRAERLTPYEEVARLMARAARHGIARVGFVTDPRPQ